jgi:hypothetical protein
MFVWRVFVVFFLHIPRFYFKSKDVRDSVGGAISFQRQLCSNSQTLNHYPFNNLKNSLKIIAQFPSMNESWYVDDGEGGGGEPKKERGSRVGLVLLGPRYLYSRDHNKTREGFKTKSCGVIGKKKKHSKHPTKGGGGKRGILKGRKG